MDARQQIIRELRSQLGLLVDEIDIVTNQLVMEYRELINFNNNNNNNYNINNYYYENAQGDIAPVLVNLDQMHNQQQQQQQWYEGMDDLGAADLDNERPILDHLQQQQQQEQWEDDLDVFDAGADNGALFDTPWSPPSPPGYQALQILQEVDGLRQDLNVLLLPEEPQQQQQQQQPEWRLHPVAAAWETPRRRPPFERPVPMRSPTPSAPQSPPLDDEQQQQQPPQQQQLTATATADGPPNFAAPMRLVPGRPR
uniref:GAT domain-containing protein n=1 Tax=Globodera pallida TaxID=36090 RepID=A0A183C8L1_GLOPA